MQISEILSKESIVLPVKNASKEEIITELANHLPLDNNNLSKDDVIKSVLEREAITSTGIGEGIAIPHAKCAIKEELIMSFGISKENIDFDSLDGKPVQIFFMLLSRKDVAGLHIRMLAKIARLLRVDKFKKSLLACNTPEEVIETFKKEEAEHSL